MVGINIDDVINVLNLIKFHLIAIGVILVLGIVALIAVKRMKKQQKYVLRWQTGIAMVLGIVLVVNLICLGPLSQMITLATGGGQLSEESSEQANALNLEVANEGIVLLDNEDSLLPLAADSPINVFGWASTNPCYGGTGSGALSPNYHVVDILEGLQSAGFQTNTELSDFYTSYMSVPTRDMACSSRFLGSFIPVVRRCRAIFASASSGVVTSHILLNVYILKGREYISPR